MTARKDKYRKDIIRCARGNSLWHVFVWGDPELLKSSVCRRSKEPVFLIRWAAMTRLYKSITRIRNRNDILYFFEYNLSDLYFFSHIYKNRVKLVMFM